MKMSEKVGKKIGVQKEKGRESVGEYETVYATENEMVGLHWSRCLFLPS